jgi:quercetin dioxygenase-like cupin family protein
MPGAQDALELSRETLEVLLRSGGEGACWSTKSDDLNVNVVAWSPGHGVDIHVNEGLDVLIVGLRGRGRIEIDRRKESLLAGSIFLIPRGVQRSIRAETRLVYLTCHRRQSEVFQISETTGSSEQQRR